MNISALIFAALLTLGGPAVRGGPAAEGFEPIFDGRALDGWQGQDMSFWSVEDGAITGTISPEHAPKLNQYLIWQGGMMDDFELKVTFRLRSTNLERQAPRLGFAPARRGEQDLLPVGTEHGIAALSLVVLLGRRFQSGSVCLDRPQAPGV